MSRRRFRKGMSTYQNTYTNLIQDICDYGGYDINKEFIMVLEDLPNAYPKPDSLIAVKSNTNYVINPLDNDLPHSDYNEEPITNHRVFDNDIATKEDGYEQVRYIFIVDHINEKGDVVVYDENDVEYTFSDSSVMVVKPYYYFAQSFKKTFEDIDYKNSILSIDMELLYDKEEILGIIENNKMLFYERVLMLTQKHISTKINKILVERGIILENVSRLVLRVVFDNIITDNIEEFYLDNFQELVKFFTKINQKGIHIDMLSNIFYRNDKKTKGIISAFKDCGVTIDSWNANKRYDYIMDTRCVSFNENITLDEIYKKITNESMYDNNIITTEESDVPYDNLLYIDESDYRQMASDGSLKMNYPLAPNDFKYIGDLQKFKRLSLTYDDLPHKYREMVDILDIGAFPRGDC